MLNNCVFIGRLVSDPEIKEIDDKKVCNITLAVPRSYKNENGEYDADFIDCVVWNNIAESTSEYCHKGDMLGVKGRVETQVYEKEDGSKHKMTQVIGDKVTFLTSNRKEKDNHEQDYE